MEYAVHLELARSARAGCVGDRAVALALARDLGSDRAGSRRRDDPVQVAAAPRAPPDLRPRLVRAPAPLPEIVRNPYSRTAGADIFRRAWNRPQNVKSEA